ncbi:MAG: branched-chain amino acid ABC transporter permease [Hyphomicrobiales bacterium]|nr:branched-chain amino acid ABC transporter permease [Hyphomicrobiales bacterium]
MPIRDLIARLLPALVVIAVLALLVAIVDLSGTRLVQNSLVEMLIMTTLVIGLYVFVGNTGITSFGHAAFICIGAYCTAWMTLPLPLKKLNMPGLPSLLHNHNLPVPVSVLVSGGLTASIAIIIGIPLLRLAGITASIATLAVYMVTAISYSNWDAVTLGTSSIVGLPGYKDAWMILAWVALAAIAARLFETSNIGLRARAARDDEVAARSVGIDILAGRLASYALSAFVLGCGGALYAHFLGTISVDAFSLSMTFVTLAMLVVGGSRSLMGAVAGTVLISLVVELLRQLERGVDVSFTVLSLPPGSQELGIALIMLCMLLVRPRGILPDRIANQTFAEPSRPVVGGSANDIAKEKTT